MLLLIRQKIRKVVVQMYLQYVKDFEALRDNMFFGTQNFKAVREKKYGRDYSHMIWCYKQSFIMEMMRCICWILTESPMIDRLIHKNWFYSTWKWVCLSAKSSSVGQLNCMTSSSLSAVPKFATRAQLNCILNRN